MTPSRFSRYVMGLIHGEMNSGSAYWDEMRVSEVEEDGDDLIVTLQGEDGAAQVIVRAIGREL